MVSSLFVTRLRLLKRRDLIVLNYREFIAIFLLDVPVAHAEEVADAGCCADANQTRQDERVIDNELADVCRARAVECKSRKVRRVCRQDVVAVGCGSHRKDDSRRRTDLQSNRNDNRNSGCLRVHQLGNEQEHDTECPRSGSHPFCQTGLQGWQVVREHRIGHPSNTVHGNDSDHTSDEHLCGANLLSRLAECEHDERGGNHEHLDDKSHRETLLADERTEFLVGTQESDESNGCKEDPKAGPLLLAELNANERHCFAVDVLLLFWVSNQGLEFFILVEVLATEDRERADEEQADDSGRPNDKAEVEHVEGFTRDHVVAFFHEADHRDEGHSSR